MRRLVGFVLLCAVVVLLVPVSIVVGAKATAPGAVLEALPTAMAIALGREPVGAGGPHAEIAGIVATMRLPRTVLALVVGVALGVAGGLIQALTRNPLADTGTLGVSAGAALAVTCGVFLGGASTPVAALWLGFLGAGLAAAVVLALARSSLGRGHPLTLLLAGAGLAATLGAITSGVVYIDPDALDALRFWQAGSLSGRGFEVVLPTVVPVATGVLLALMLGPALNMISLGTEAATALGANVKRVTVLGFVAITLLAGAATAAAGPIAFAGLVVPHIVRVVTGPDYRWLLPYSAIAGAGMLLLADVLGRVLLRPGELQAGVVVALVGAPFFVWLVRRRSLVAL